MQDKKDKGAGSGIPMAVGTARDARSLSKAAAHAASGNAAGVAVEVAKNPQVFLKIIVAIVLVISMLLLCIMSIPSMMWSVAEGVFDSIATMWDEAGGTTGNHITDNLLQVVNFIKGIETSIADTIKNAFSSAWGAVKNFFLGENDGSSENLEATEEGLMSGIDEEAQKENFDDICTRTSKRYLDRYCALLEEVEKDSAVRATMYDDYSMTLVTPYPSVQRITWLDMLLSPEETKQKYESFFNQTKRSAVEILAAYTVQHSGAIGEDVKWSEYSDWLGAENVDGFGPFGLKKYKVNGWLTECVEWQGTFMTQPDYEIMLHDMEEDRKASGISSADFDKNAWLDEHLADYEDKQESVLNRFLQHDPNGPKLVEWTTTSSSGNTITHCRATYTIQKASMENVGKDVMEFQEGFRNQGYDSELFGE